jgi:hypothetical protein
VGSISITSSVKSARFGLDFVDFSVRAAARVMSADVRPLSMPPSAQSPGVNFTLAEFWGF